LEPPPELPGVEHRYVDAGGLRMHVAEAGEGSPVVLLHGWPQHWWLWRAVIPRLAERHRVLCPDLRGFGWSGAPPSGYEKESLATDVLCLLDALGLERVHLAGHDWGGVVGMLLCLRAPERVERFLPLNCGTVWPTPDARALRNLHQFAYMPLMAAPLVGRKLQASELFAKVMAKNTPWSDEERRVYLAPLRDPARAAAGSAVYRSFLLHDLPGWIRGRYRGTRLRVPTLMLHGERDPVIRPFMLEDWEEHADDARTELVPGVAHFVVDEAPELVAGRALDFFAG